MKCPTCEMLERTTAIEHDATIIQAAVEAAFMRGLLIGAQTLSVTRVIMALCPKHRAAATAALPTIRGRL